MIVFVRREKALQQRNRAVENDAALTAGICANLNLRLVEQRAGPDEGLRLGVEIYVLEEAAELQLLILWRKCKRKFEVRDMKS